MKFSHPWWFHFLPVITAMMLPLWFYPHARNALRFPLRVIIGVLLCFAVYLFIRDSAWLVRWFAERSKVRAERWRIFAQRYGGWFKGFEACVAAVVLVIAAVSAFQILLPMLHSSLKTDEIGAITRYSSRGAAYSMHNYDLAKNHIFFSVVNAVTPGSKSYHPARARFWAMVAVLTGLVLLAHEFIRRGEFMAGAFAVFLPSTNPWLLSLLYEGRGYGFIALAALLCLIAVQRRWESPTQTGGLVLLSVAAVLGTFTLPFFVLFGGVLLAIVFLRERSRQTFLAGWFSLAAIFALYSQVIGAVLSVATEYDEDYELGFTEFSDAMRILGYSVPSSLVRVDIFLFFAIVAAVLVVPVIFSGLNAARNRVLNTGFGLILFFAAVCLFLQTPPPRITSFLGFPFALCAGLLLSAVLNSPSVGLLRPILVAGFGLVLAFAGVRQIQSFEFNAPARWLEAGAIIDTAFPEDIPVITPSYRNNIAAYLSPERPAHEEDPDWSNVISGHDIVFDPSHKREHPKLYRPPRGLQSIALPNSTSEQTIYFSIQDADRLESSSTGNLIEVVIPVGRPLHALNFLASVSWPRERDIQIAVTSADGKTRELRPSQFLAVENILSIPQESIPPDSKVSVQLPGNPTLHVEEVWAPKQGAGKN